MAYSPGFLKSAKKALSGAAHNRTLSSSLIPTDIGNTVIRGEPIASLPLQHFHCSRDNQLFFMFSVNPIPVVIERLRNCISEDAATEKGRIKV